MHEYTIQLTLSLHTQKCMLDGKKKNVNGIVAT